MRIVKLLGGLGNQMFQFALYEALRRQHPDERMLVDLRCFKGYHKHRGFELDKVFGVKAEKASWTEVAKILTSNAGASVADCYLRERPCSANRRTSPWSLTP